MKDEGMMQKAVIILVIIICRFGGVVNANQINHVVGGGVKSKAGETLIGATVVVKEQSFGAITNINGEYRFKVKTGKYNLIASYIGYKDKSIEIDVTKDCNYDFVLEEDVLQITDVLVKGESKIVHIRSNVYSVNAIDIASQVSSIQSISDVVNKSVGVSIRRDGGVGSDYDLTLNGMGGNAIRYFIDGVPLDSKGGDFSLDNIPPNIVERVEIYKGVVPTHLGGDALGGAIDIITKQNKKNYYDISYGIGSFNTHKLDFNAQIIAPKSGITIKPTFGISYTKNNYLMKDVRVLNPENNNFEIADCERFHDDYKSIFGQIEFGVTNKKWADYLYISGSITDIDKDIQTGVTQDVVYGAARRESLAWNLSARYKKEGFLTENLTFIANASHTWQNSSIIDTALVQYYWNGHFRKSSSAEMNDYPVIRHYKRPLTTFRSNLDYKIGNSSSLNLNYLLSRSGNKMTEEADVESKMKPSDDILTRHFIGLSYNIDLFEKRWHSSIFIKEYINSVMIEDKDYDAYDDYHTGYADAERDVTAYFTGYGVGTRYKFLDAISLKGSYEYSVRLPGAFELLGDGENIYPNFLLEPEKSNNYNVSVYGTIDIGQSSLSYEAGGFYRDIHDFIMAVQNRESYTFKNMSNIRISGFEGELIYQFRNALQLRANVSYENAEDMMEAKISDGKPNAAYRQKVPNRPSFYSNMGARYTFKDIFEGSDKLMLEYTYGYVQWFYLTWAAYGAPESKSIIPTQHNHSITATYSWCQNKYSVSLDCNNIFDSRLYDNFKLQKPGRAFYGKFRVFFN